MSGAELDTMADAVMKAFREQAPGAARFYDEALEGQAKLLSSLQRALCSESPEECSAYSADVANNIRLVAEKMRVAKKLFSKFVISSPKLYYAFPVAK